MARSWDASERQQPTFAHFNAHAAPAQRLQSMGNAKNGAINELFFKNRLEMLFSLLVERRSGLVQEEHGGFFKKNASEANLQQA